MSWKGRLLAALLLAAAGASAREKPTTWRLGTVELPPSVGERLPQQGYYPVLLRRILQELGASAELVFLPPNRVHQELRAGHLDGAFPYLRTPEREAEFLLTEPFFHARVRVFVNADTDWRPRDVPALRGQLGCALQGAQSPAALQAEVDAGHVQLQRVGELEACFRMLQLGRVRFVVSGENGGWTAARSLPGQGMELHMADFVLAEEGIHLALPRSKPESAARLKAFNTALRKLRANGVLQALEARSVPKPPSAAR